MVFVLLKVPDFLCCTSLLLACCWLSTQVLSVGLVLDIQTLISRT